MKPLTLDQLRGLRHLLDTGLEQITDARNAVLAEDVGKAVLHLIHADRCVRDAIADLREIVTGST